MICKHDLFGILSNTGNFCLYKRVTLVARLGLNPSGWGLPIEAWQWLVMIR